MCDVSCKIVFLDFASHQNYKIVISQHFISWILLQSAGKKEGKRTGTPSIGCPGRTGLGPGQSPWKYFYRL
jgi:hypothetical protein